MKNKVLAGIVMAAGIAVSSAASAAVVTFDSLRSANNYSLGYGFTYVEQGLGFRAYGTDGRDEHMFIWGFATNPNRQADPVGASPWVNSINAFLRIEKVGGGTFSLNSLDLADYTNMQAPLGSFAMSYSYVDGSGSHSGVFNLDKTAGLQTFTVNLANISRMDLFTGDNSGPGVQIDNVRFNEAITAPVPEPSAWALMLLGFGSLGAALRKRRRLMA